MDRPYKYNSRVACSATPTACPLVGIGLFWLSFVMLGSVSAQIEANPLRGFAPAAIGDAKSTLTSAAPPQEPLGRDYEATAVQGEPTGVERNTSRVWPALPAADAATRELPPGYRNFQHIVSLTPESDLATAPRSSPSSHSESDTSPRDESEAVPTNRGTPPKWDRNVEPAAFKSTSKPTRGSGVSAPELRSSDELLPGLPWDSTLRKIAGNTLLVLTIVVTFLYVAYKSRVPWRKLPGGQSTPLLVEHSLSIGPKAHLKLIKVGEQRVLVAVDGQGVKSVVHLHEAFPSEFALNEGFEVSRDSAHPTSTVVPNQSPARVEPRRTAPPVASHSSGAGLWELMQQNPEFQRWLNQYQQSPAAARSGESLHSRKGT